MYKGMVRILVAAKAEPNAARMAINVNASRAPNQGYRSVTMAVSTKQTELRTAKRICSGTNASKMRSYEPKLANRPAKQTRIPKIVTATVKPS